MDCHDRSAAHELFPCASAVDVNSCSAEQAHARPRILADYSEKPVYSPRWPAGLPFAARVERIPWFAGSGASRRPRLHHYGGVDQTSNTDFGRRTELAA